MTFMLVPISFRKILLIAMPSITTLLVVLLVITSSKYNYIPVNLTGVYVNTPERLDYIINNKDHKEPLLSDLNSYAKIESGSIYIRHESVTINGNIVSINKKANNHFAIKLDSGDEVALIFKNTLVVQSEKLNILGNVFYRQNNRN